jgi:catechol 2,3-dioxygenase-like lactoylglutathione lyase family enzyme
MIPGACSPLAGSRHVSEGAILPAIPSGYAYAPTVLGSSDLVGFVPVTDLSQARAFYGDVLGLDQLGESPIAVLFNANGTLLRATLVESLTPAPFTVLGWSVQAIEDVVRHLSSQGIVFERFPGMEQDDLCIWTTPGADKVAWFKDPDGNVLSLTQVH